VEREDRYCRLEGGVESRVQPTGQHDRNAFDAEVVSYVNVELNTLLDRDRVTTGFDDGDRWYNVVALERLERLLVASGQQDCADCKTS
jgi:hypothetical protein